MTQTPKSNELEAIRQSGRALTTPVIVTNRNRISPKNASLVQSGEPIFIINA